MKKNNKLFQIIYAVGLIVLVIVAVMQLLRNDVSHLLSNPSLRTTLEKRKITAAFDPLVEEKKDRERKIEQLQVRLLSPKLSPTERQRINNRLKVEIFEATHIAVPLNPQHTLVIETPDPAKVFTIKPGFGIIDAAKPFSPNYIKVNNIWRGQIGTEIFMVYAGFYTKNKEQGIMIVLPVSKMENMDYQIFPTETESGGLEIIKYEGALLTIQSKKGTIFIFDVASRKYLDVNPQTQTPIPLSTNK